MCVRELLCELLCCAIVINNYDGRSSADRQIRDYLYSQFATQVLQTAIGRDAPLGEYFSAQASIFRYRRSARSAGQFLALADEIKGCFHGVCEAEHAGIESGPVLSSERPISPEGRRSSYATIGPSGRSAHSIW
jgi:hypothetical protein